MDGMLYGYMLGGGTLMAAVAAMTVNFLPMTGSGKYVIIGVFAFFAFGIHMGFLTWLQAELCSGVKSFTAIGVASLVGTVCAAGFMALPLFMDWARLAFSDLVMTHYALLTPEVAEFANKFMSVMRGGALNDIPNEKKEPSASSSLALKNLLQQSQYDIQTVTETAISAPVWAFFAGALGIGAGNLISGSQCN
jgi:hypothetical protein